jgi:uncharacterized protein (TIGR02996 family)
MTEERAFLLAILERPDDDAPKLIYADWLEERGDPRAEFLQLVVKSRQERAVTPDQRRRHDELSAELAELHVRQQREWRRGFDRRPPQGFQERQRRVRELEGQLADLSRAIRPAVPARLRELAATLDPNWLAVVSDTGIEGCGKGTRGGGSLRFDFICDRSWADMGPTADNNVRHCETCRKDVYFCDNLADAREHSREGRCIAVDVGVIRRDGDLQPRTMFVGQPSKESLRRADEEDVDPVSRARLDAREQAGKKRPRRR